MRRSLLTLGLLFIAGPCWGAEALVNHACFGNLTITSNAVTQALGWTVAPSGFLLLEISSGSAVTINNATASGTSMVQDATVVNNEQATLFRLANAGGSASITINFTSSNGSIIAICAAEWSGVSLTATPTNTAVTGSSGAVNTNTWTNGAYTAGTNDLVVTGAVAAIFHTGTWAAGGSWFLVDSQGVVTGNQGLALQDQLNVSAGSFTGTGTWSQGAADGAHYAYFTVSYPAAPISGGGGFGGNGGIGGRGGVGE